MATFCTASDVKLQMDGSESQLAKLARPKGSAATTLDDSEVSARLTRIITEQSNAIRARLIGKVDVDNVSSGSQLADDLRRWATLFVLEDLYTTNGMISEQANPYLRKKRDAVEEIRAVARMEQRIGDPAGPNMGTGSNTTGRSPVYGKAATGGSGTDSSLLDKFA